jgi:hypothetical protein
MAAQCSGVHPFCGVCVARRSGDVSQGERKTTDATKHFVATHLADVRHVSAAVQRRRGCLHVANL